MTYQLHIRFFKKIEKGGFKYFIKIRLVLTSYFSHSPFVQNVSRLFNNPMDFFDHPYYRLSKLLLLMVGQWPNQNPNVRLLSLCFVTFLTTSIITTEFLLLYTSKGALEFMADAVAGIALMTTISIKCHTCYFAGDKIRKLLNKIEDEWKIWKSKEEITILEKYAKEGRFYIIGYISKIS
ncbi:uncharacterized protein LOC124429194 [Vespa crabro]|uniref:uncharacterized protein LOC124429194 n=1 Tax=Vespa crabro TaxID=7445 RepID=UPI001EFF6A81|nr:uncharacterized protein LOC124429194 [Vespa crabro]